MAEDSPVVGFGTKGMNSAVDPFLLGPDQVHKAVNCRLSKQAWRTRYGIRAMRLCGDADTVQTYREGNTQGAIYYNPARGQGALVFGDDISSIAESSGGQMFALESAGKYCFNVRDISGGLRSPRHVHLAWLCQAENYLFRSDDVSDTWAFDGFDAAFSPGYIASGDSREFSKIPNRIGAMIYAFGRMHVVRSGREILVGDALHSKNLTSSINVGAFTEQTYWATGQHFSPPSQMGAIIAGAILPLQDSTHGHSELLWHAKNDGVFSLNTNISPRSAWADQALTRHVLLSTAAVGPYAVALSESDQYFRSSNGIQSLRSARAERDRIGSPYADLAAEVRVFMAGDLPQDLRFCSLARWQRQNRIFCTVYPVVEGRYRWHRGFVVSNLLPGEVRADTPPAWEGLWTLPPQWGGVSQFVAGSFEGSERIFAICWNHESKKKHVVEVDETLSSDVFADGASSRISCQIITKHLAPAGLFKTAELAEAFLLITRVQTAIDWQVDYRVNGQRTWHKWSSGAIAEPANPDLWNQEREIPDDTHPLGPVPKFGNVRSVQFRIRWRGAASIQFMVRHAHGKALESSVKRSAGAMVGAGDDDYEYNNSGPRWEDSTPQTPCLST